MIPADGRGKQGLSGLGRYALGVGMLAVGMGISASIDKIRGLIPNRSMGLAQLLVPICALVMLPVSVGAQPTTGASRHDSDPSFIVEEAVRIAAMIDQFDIATVWDASSKLMKATTSKNEFVAKAAHERSSLGNIITRKWRAIERVQVTHIVGGLPKGLYVTVDFETSGSQATMKEMVSFHFEADTGGWKLVGYSIR